MSDELGSASILSELREISGRLGAIERHLADLNGTVARQQAEIAEAQSRLATHHQELYGPFGRTGLTDDIHNLMNIVRPGSHTTMRNVWVAVSALVAVASLFALLLLGIQ